MAIPDGVSPADVLPRGDPGDETGNRYHYQWSYTAVLACGLFDPDVGVVEIYCEFHDDVLAKHVDGRFHAVQVKTRQPGNELWKANDPDMLAAMVRFAGFERDYGERFWRYSIATNHQFFRAKENGSNIPYLLRLAHESREPDPASVSKQLATFVKRLVRESKCDPPVVLAMLQKARCDDTPPKLAGIRRELCDLVRSCSDTGDEATFPALAAAADALAAEVCRASTLQHAQSIPLYLTLRPDDLEEKDRLRRDGKRLTKERVAGVVESFLTATELLSPADPALPPPPPTGESRMKRKLNAGGLSAMTVNSAQDCSSAAFRQQRAWASKYGERAALKRYHHLSTVVQAEAAQAYEATVKDEGPFGRAMLAALGSRIRARRSDPGTKLCGCTEEHLLGYAYLLTQRCRVWWSKPFDLPEEG